MTAPGTGPRFTGIGGIARAASLELLALISVAAVVILLRSCGMRMGWQALEFTLPPMLTSLPRILLAGATLHLLATALTFVGSLATGWHYAIGGYAGMLLAWLVLMVARRVEPETPAPPDLATDVGGQTVVR